MVDGGVKTPLSGSLSLKQSDVHGWWFQANLKQIVNFTPSSSSSSIIVVIIIIILTVIITITIIIIIIITVVIIIIPHQVVNNTHFKPPATFT